MDWKGSFDALDGNFIFYHQAPVMVTPNKGHRITVITVNHW